MDLANLLQKTLSLKEVSVPKGNQEALAPVPTHLNLSQKELTALLLSDVNLTLLARLALYDKGITELPESIGTLTGLKWLSLSNNQLTKLVDAEKVEKLPQNIL